MRRRSFLTLASAAAVSALAGCSTGPAKNEAAGTAGAGGDKAAPGFPVTIKHALGTTTIKTPPTRIATLGWSDADTVLALGMVPVGCPRIDWGGNKNASTDWFDAELKKQGGSQPTRYSDADGIPVDEVAKLQPDLILGTNSGLTKKDYETLSKICPVIAYPGDMWGTSWQQTLTMVGQAMGKATKAKAMLISTEKAIKDAVAKYPQIKGKTAAWLWFTPSDKSKFGAYTVLDNRPKMLAQLGMKDAPLIKRLSAGSKKYSVDIAAEKASTLDAEVVVMYIDKAGQDAQIKADPLLGRIPALKSGAYYASADNATALTMSSPTPLSIPVMLTKFVPQLAAAAGKA